ncbi:MAG: translation initiation factor IF-2, partial [Collinsella sp.]|nr:translation initiation factor IF-2 [Collinsella sp.]
MAKVRVSTLAKEFGMTSKELMGHLAEMKIPAKSASSALEDAYVAMVRKQLASVIEARAQEVEAAKQAEEEAAAAEEAARAAEAERERIAAEKAREEERRQFAAAQAAEEAARAEAEAKKKAEQERLAREKEEAAREAQRRAVPASDSGSRFRSLLDQIAAQETVLKEKKDAEDKAKAERGNRRGGNNDRRGGRRNDRNASESRPHSHRTNASNNVAAGMDFPNPDKQGKGKKRKGGHNSEEDHYSRMAREAEEYSREKVLEEARAAVEEASRESTGRRKKRKEKREREAARAQEERKIEEALAQGVNPEELDAIKVSQGVTVQELAEALDVPANDIIKRLFLLGTPLTMTQSMSDDLVELVADDLGRQIRIITPEEENTFSFYDDPADLKPRAPVVTVMGHVDHGKTSLLDAIRHTGVAAGEAGGITQAIGASQVMINDRKITFIDTPGHATFTAMRARGAKVTDIVILIVAADDGVMPQTVESINHAKAAGVPIVVAVNKIDKPGANPDRVRQELTEYGVIPEEWGGQNMFVNISAKQKIGIDDLLETVLLQADVLELKANPDTFASGNVLEAKLDKGRGSVATVLVTRGTLHVGDTLVAGLTYGRVRAMLDPKGRAVTEAGPSDAVEILGLQSVPNAGDEFRVFQDDSEARDQADQRALQARIEEQNRVKHVTLENLFDTMADAEVKELNLIIKADVQGSIEALQDSLDKMDQSEVRINTIHAAVGAINETDVVLADASNAIIIGFGVRPDGKARSAAEHQGVEIRCYDVIYKALEDLDAAR